MSHLRRLPFVFLVLLASAPAPAEDTPHVTPPFEVLADTPFLIEPVSGLGHNRLEEAQSRRIVAEWAAGKGIVHVDADRATEWFAAAARGEDPRTGKACGRKLSDYVAETRWWDMMGARGSLASTIQCSNGDCVLILSAIDGAGFDGAERARWSAPFDETRPWHEALGDALANLAPGSPERGGGVSGIIGGESPKVVAEPERLSVSLRAATGWDHFSLRKDALVLDGPPLRACFPEGEGDVEALLEIGAEGSIARCESRTVDSPESACVCEALVARGNAHAASHGKRAYATITLRPAEWVTPKNQVVRASVGATREWVQVPSVGKRFLPVVSDPSIRDWDPPSEQTVETCFRKWSRGSTVKVGATIRFDEVGKATGVDFASDASPMDKAHASCLREALLQSEAPCPASPLTWAKAYVKITFPEITSPR
jgi:hypothetical protein